MNTTIDLIQLGITISAERMKIPPMNIRKYDIESKDLYAAIKTAVKAGDYDKAERLLAHWTERLPWFHKPNFCDTPPHLTRQDGESIEDYLKRCHSEMP